MRTVGIVGGGAAGMTAAAAAAAAGASVTVFEHTDRPGKKLLSTGNGRCNLGNAKIFREAYRGDPGFALRVIEGFSVEETLAFFARIGVYPVSQGGYYYPRSMQAASVRGALEAELKRLGVNCVCGVRIRSAAKSGGRFVLRTDREEYSVDRLILACGGAAAPSTGSDGSGYALAKGFGLTVIPPAPALVPLTARWRELKNLNGVRVRAGIALRIGGRQTDTASGELQLCEYGLSGIPAFQVSRWAARAVLEDGAPPMEAELDFFEEFSPEELHALLLEQADLRRDARCGDFLSGLLPDKLGRALMREAGIGFDRTAGELGGRELLRLAETGKRLRIPVTGTLGFDRAQTCSGGIAAAQLDPATMECRKVPGLYAAGEIIDADGICGGYNLQFAWSGGYLAGTAAAK